MATTDFEYSLAAGKLERLDHRRDERGLRCHL
jgi:hypothetical protein